MAEISRRDFLKMVVVATGGAVGAFLGMDFLSKLYPSTNQGTRPTMQPTPTTEATAISNATERVHTPDYLRKLIIEIDETSVPWPDVSEQEGGIPYNDEPDFEGKNIEGRSRLTINTGTGDFEWVGGGRFAFVGSVDEGIGEGIGIKITGIAHSEGEVFIDPRSGQVLYIKNGGKIVIPGGNDDDESNPYERGNLVFVLGNPTDNTSTDLEVDTASNYREKRGSGILNEDPLSDNGKRLIAAMAKVYAKSMYEGGSCKGRGCKDGIGIYVLKGGDKNTGRNAELIFAAVLSPEELSRITLAK